MINSATETDAPYEEYYQNLLRRVAYRRSLSQEMDWLFDSANTLPVLPDYLELKTVGRSVKEQIINQTLFRLSRALWFRLFWPRIRNDILDYSATTYFPLFFSKTSQTARIEAAQKEALGAVETFLGRPWPNLGRCSLSEVGFMVNEVFRSCYQALGCPEDLFAQDKQQQNQTCLEFMDKHLDRLPDHPRLLEILVYGSCASNWLDLLEGDAAQTFPTVERDYDLMMAEPGKLADLSRANPYYQIDRFKQLISSRSQHILFECDNCGELIFDLLLIRHLLDLGHRVTLGAKAGPVLNDATVEDVEGLLAEDVFRPLDSAREEGRLSLLPISSVMGGKLLYEVEEGYKKAYGAADLVILKGQGNFQTMPLGVRRRGRFVPYRYRKPMVVIMPVKSVMSELCLNAVFSRPPADRSLFLYCYDPSDPKTYP